MDILTTTVSVDTTGVAASATGSADSASLNGILLDVYLAFHASAPNTTDTTIAYKVTGGNIMVKSNSSTSALFVPRKGAVDAAAAAITDSHTYYILDGQKLTVSLAGCDELTAAVVATIRYLRL